MTPTESAPLTPDFFDPDCPVQTIPVLGGRKWAWKIMRCLEGGPRRFSELRVPLVGITSKVLAESLRAMESEGAVIRTAYDENPPRVEYALTPLGHTLLGPMDAVCAWSRQNLASLLEAREAYERDEGGRAARAHWAGAHRARVRFGPGAGSGTGSGPGSISAADGGRTAGGSGPAAAILDA
ncbi:winged helix-turn-helix transcriptional regulator [Kitasatospora sp. NPDC091207]|uniref:winged helix-turn-helix transcriptional regulator n=1 Tax=Kitasatospora sp. NPDC091207 TaxID=3364083 RepID=UPI00381BD598